jgi:phosphatidylserine/phosphatidylglycerophosphate/cardiolipin synthase-like enzyme
MNSFKPTRDLAYLVVIALLLALCGQLYYTTRLHPAFETRVYYNHDEALNNQITSLIRDADKFVYFGIYTFTRQDIKNALLGAKYRGLDVRGITDRDQTDKVALQGKIIKELRDAGIPVAEQDHSGIMHLKAIVTDKGYASGSFNWTSSATNLNDEVLEVGTQEPIRNQYEKILREVITKYAH